MATQDALLYYAPILSCLLDRKHIYVSQAVGSSEGEQDQSFAYGHHSKHAHYLDDERSSHRHMKQVRVIGMNNEAQNVLAMHKVASFVPGTA